MTFRRELFVGGFKNVSKPSPKTGATGGFVGCVRRLQINGKDYDMRKGSFIGDTLYGINVGQLLNASSTIFAARSHPYSTINNCRKLKLNNIPSSSSSSFIHQNAST